MTVGSITSKSARLAGMMRGARRSLSSALERLSAASDEHFAHGFTSFIAALERQFRHEEAAMEALDYPALRGHREQQARALGVLHRAAARVDAGDVVLGREILPLLPTWLLLHHPTQDVTLLAALARPVPTPPAAHSDAVAPQGHRYV